jgi:hypothetical protein
MILNVVNFGGFIYAWIAVSNAARAGADYMVMGPASVGGPVLTTDAQTQALVAADLHALPNSASVVVAVCTMYTSPACTPPADPESATLYADGSVTVTYTYIPLIAVGYKVFGIPLTLPATTIRRKAIERIIQ